MKKLTKKILSLALAMLMAASLASVAFAAGEITVTGDGTAAAVSGTAITAYYSESGCYVTLTAASSGSSAYTGDVVNWVLPDTVHAHFLVNGTSLAQTTSAPGGAVQLYLDAVTGGTPMTLKVGTLGYMQNSSILNSQGTTYNLNIQQDTVAGVAVTPTAVSNLSCGGTAALTPTVTYAHNNTAQKAVTWISDNTAATVSNGTVTGVAPGTATITAAAGTVNSNGVAVTVVPGITVASNGDGKLDVGDAGENLTAMVNPADGGSDYSYIWSVPDGSPVTLTPAADGKTATVAA
ncbi:MAG TPA: Ig-like domain-containing protein, partial [Oscillospiraceae bacterium]|nr:Ig-like domain-containing protein [Oscillospiraceae bacterium]